MKTVKFYTLGCKVNQYETQSIREQFIKAGFKELEDSQPADFYIINTCSVTLRADSESLSLIRRASRENPQAKIVVTGCLTEMDEDKSKIEKAAKVDLVVKNKDKNRILEFLNEPNEQTSLTHNGISYFSGHTRAFLKIQDGCDNFCSYCKVPLVRGESKSKALSAAIQEAEALVENDYKEIVLTGICLGAFGRDLKPRLSLIDAISALENIEGLLRIRLSSIEAGDICDELIERIAKSKKLCPHLHIPIQSGDDEILQKMKRRYSRKDYLGLIKKIKKQIPGLAITTDVLVGFPGEREENFQATLDLVQEIAPLKVHIFPYSPRAGTCAAQLVDKINPLVIKKRMARLKNIAQECSLTYRKQFLNKDMDVLIEHKLKDDSHFWEGYTSNYIPVIIDSKKDLKNQLISLKLKQILKDFVRADFLL